MRQVKQETVAAKVWHMSDHIPLTLSPPIDIKSPHISAPSLQCARQSPDVEAEQSSGNM